MLNVDMLPLELWEFDRETKFGHTDSDGLQCERTPLFSPTLCSKKSDPVDFVKLNNHGNLCLIIKYVQHGLSMY